MVSHKTLSNWYIQLAEHLASGSPLAETLRLAEGPSRKDRLRMADSIEAGTSIADVMATAPAWLPRADRVFICAAMETGRLPQTLKSLSDRHELIGSTQFKAILGLIYPLGVYHLAALILPIVNMIDFEVGFEWDARQHLLLSTALILPIWALTAFITLLVKTDNPLLPRILRCIPLLRRYSKSQALADFSFALGTFVEAGVPMHTAWLGSIRIAHDPALTKVYHALQPVFESGHNPAANLKEHKVFPPKFIAFYKTGTESGQLDQTLLKAGRIFQTQANQAMSFASMLYPTILFACVAGFIIYNIFKIFGDYVNVLTKMME
jgi:type II secretory pathway component PulF